MFNEKLQQLQDYVRIPFRFDFTLKSYTWRHTCTPVWRKATLYRIGFHMGRLLTSNWFWDIPANVRFKPARTPWGGSLVNFIED